MTPSFFFIRNTSPGPFWPTLPYTPPLHPPLPPTNTPKSKQNHYFLSEKIIFFSKSGFSVKFSTKKCQNSFPTIFYWFFYTGVQFYALKIWKKIQIDPFWQLSKQKIFLLASHLQKNNFVVEDLQEAYSAPLAVLISLKINKIHYSGQFWLKI